MEVACSRRFVAVGEKNTEKEAFFRADVTGQDPSRKQVISIHAPCAFCLACLDALPPYSLHSLSTNRKYHYYSQLSY